MSEIVTARVTQYPKEDLYRPEPADSYHHAFEFELRTNESVLILGDENASLNVADGWTVLPAMIAQNGLPVITENYGFETGRATISGGNIIVLDLQNSFSDFLAEKQINNRALMNSTCRIYMWAEGAVMDRKRDLMYTFVCGNVSYRHGGFSVAVSDINRNTEVKIFTPQSWRLNETLEIDATDIILTNRFADSQFTNLDEFLDFHDHRFQHSERYYQDPGENVRYFWLEGNDAENGKKIEIISTTDRGRVVNDRIHYTIKERELFQTKTFEWAVDPVIKDNNKQEVREFPYLEGDPAELIKILYTRESFDGYKAPDHWGAGIDEKFIDLNTLARYSNKEIRIIAGPEEVVAKKYIEDEFLIPAPAVFTINPRGQLTYAPLVDEGAVGSYQETFDESNVDLKTVSDYYQETKNVKSIVGIKWGYNPILKLFLQPTYWADEVAQDRNRSEDVIIYESKTLRSGHFTEESIQRWGGILYDRHINPTQRINFGVDFDSRWIPGGTRCRIKFKDIIRDHISGQATSKDLDREMTLIGKVVDLSRHTCKFNFQGYDDKGESVFASSGPTISESEFRRNGIDIKTVPGTVWNAANSKLTGSPELSLNQKYYSIGTIELADGFTPTWKEQHGTAFRLHVMGQLFISCELDLTGRGTTIGGNGSVGAALETPGQSGYFGTTEPGGTFDIFDLYFFGTGGRVEATSKRSVREQARGLHNSHKIKLSHQGGILSGFPADSSGSSGGGSGRSARLGGGVGARPGQQYWDGHDGGDGGCGFEFVSYPGSDILTSGRLISDGGDAEPGIVVGDQMATTAGGPGAPGVLSWGVDGHGTKPVITPLNFHAHVGQAVSPGAPFSAPKRNYDAIPITQMPLNHSYYEPTAPLNLWRIAHDIAYVPSEAVAVERPIDEFDLEASLNPDANVKLIVSNVEPSNGNNRDLWITIPELERDTPEPTVRRFNSSTGTWDDVIYPDSIVTVLVQTERTYGANDGTVLYFSDDGNPPEKFDRNDLWLDQANDILWRLGPPHIEVNREEYGYYTADSYLADGSFVKYLAGEDTIIFSEDKNLLPSTEYTAPALGPGETLDAFTVLNGVSYWYETVGAAQWNFQFGNIAESVAAGSTGDGIIFVRGDGSTPFLADDEPRDIWIYAKAAVAGSVLKIQSAGDNTSVGDPARQAEITINNTTNFEWLKLTGGAMNGQVRAFAGSLQIRTAVAGIEFIRIILLDENSTSVPVGVAGLSAPANSDSVPKPYFPKGNYASRSDPVPWAHVAAGIGDGGTPGIRLTAGGVNTFRYFAERYLVPVHAGRKYQLTSRVKWDSINRTSSANQGYAVLLHLYDAYGALRATNDVDNVAVAGASHWFGEVRPAFSTVSEVMEVPESASNIVWMSVRPMVHAQSGQMVISEIKLKELTRSEHARVDATINLGDILLPETNPLSSARFRSTGEIPSEEWSNLKIVTGQQIDINLHCHVSANRGRITGNMIFIAEFEDGTTQGLAIGQGGLGSEEYGIGGQGLSVPAGRPSGYISKTARYVAEKTIRRIYLYYTFGSIETAGNQATNITISELTYTVGEDQPIREGW